MYVTSRIIIFFNTHFSKDTFKYMYIWYRDEVLYFKGNIACKSRIGLPVHYYLTQRTANQVEEQHENCLENHFCYPTHEQT